MRFYGFTMSLGFIKQPQITFDILLHAINLPLSSFPERGSNGLGYGLERCNARWDFYDTQIYCLTTTSFAIGILLLPMVGNDFTMFGFQSVNNRLIISITYRFFHSTVGPRINGTTRRPKLAKNHQKS